MLKYNRLNMFWTLPVSKGAEVIGNSVLANNFQFYRFSSIGFQNVIQKAF